MARITGAAGAWQPLRSKIDALHPPRSILVAVDFSAASHAALVLAGRLARHSRAALHVLFVEDQFLETAAERAGIDGAAASRIEWRRLIREGWPASACSPRLHVAAGSAVNVILNVAHADRVALSVIPSGPPAAVERLTLTSTIQRRLRRTNVSVLVVPASCTPAESDADCPSTTGADATLDAILGTSVQIVRGVKGSRVAPLAYRALSAATIPLLLQVVESLLE